MAILNILEFPDPRLRTKAKSIDPGKIDDTLRAFIDDMLETMYAAPGIGLAATQVDFHQRLVVIDVSEGKDQPLVLINPEITAKQGSQTYQEGCLSVPEIFADVERADTVTITALDRDGKPYELTADGLLAVCIQHELDHLDGKVFVDYLSPLKRELVRKKLLKAQRERARSAA